MTTARLRLDAYRTGSPLLTNLGLCVLGAMLLGLSRHLAVEFDHFVYGYSETSTVAVLVALGAALIVYTQPVNRYTLGIIAAFALLCRLTLLMPEPSLSTDVYRYVWDGIVQHHGINPYRYFPGNEHLRALRDDDIFPNINRRDYAPTIYPPIAQMFFFCVTWLSGTLTVMKLAMTGMEAVTVYALAKLLEEMGRPREQVILYAWSPLCIWEFGSSGHLDAAVIAMMALALLFRFRNRPVLTGLALGAAIMFKFYPLVLFPALWRRRDWKMPAAVLAVIAGGYAVYAEVGLKVFGFAGGYAAEEGMSSGSRYFLLDALRHLPGLHNAPNALFVGFTVAVFAALVWWCWLRSDVPPRSEHTLQSDAPLRSGDPLRSNAPLRSEDPLRRNVSLRILADRSAFLRPALALAFALMLLFSPHYPWYVAWLLPFAVLVPSLPVVVYTYSVFYWLTTQYAEPGPKMFFANQWIYTATGLAFLLAFAWRSWRGRAAVAAVAAGA